MLIKISPDDAATLQAVSPEQIIRRLQDDVGDSPKARGIIAAKKLHSGDIILHLERTEDKARLQASTEWTSRLCPSAKIHTKSFAVLLHGVSTAGGARSDLEHLSRSIEADNTKLHPGLKIKKASWLRKPDEKKRFTSLIIQVESATLANRMISEGVLLRYELKVAELYDRRSRITQCFKCQQYGGHTSHSCKLPTKCGNCGQDHTTAECTTDTHTTPRSCAACNGANHQAWSPLCPARKKEGERARLARETQPLLFPIPAPSQLFSGGSSQPPASRQPFDSSAPVEWTTSEIGQKKRKVLGRPPKAATVDTNFGAIHSFVSQRGSIENVRETPPPASNLSEMTMDCTPLTANASQSD